MRARDHCLVAGHVPDAPIAPHRTRNQRERISQAPIDPTLLEQDHLKRGDVDASIRRDDEAAGVAFRIADDDAPNTCCR